MSVPPPDPSAALPDAQSLYRELLRQLRPAVSHTAGIVGIATGGAWLAERLHADLWSRGPLGRLDTSFYRDDVEERGLKTQVSPSNLPFEVDGRDILLVDDVLYTGRTVRAAMNELFDYGRPARIDLAVLADRGGRQLPVAATYLGGTANVPDGKILMLERAEGGVLSLRLSDKRRERSSR